MFSGFFARMDGTQCAGSFILTAKKIHGICTKSVCYVPFRSYTLDLDENVPRLKVCGAVGHSHALTAAQNRLTIILIIR